ncbi:Restriction endonuclease subunit S [Rubrivivax sp. A210]|uniref:restriction endonuclease subunit S n=1 Tax=Rubrivivax sp. A210 TaxID=2772301 RepID=UPI001918C5BE|nr:restriction endonuclease subunit S [Rubrivivax sp. A210]CAD5366520.1 Restriction endonuclease subunit S [Rubrivivax sp. A210]
MCNSAGTLPSWPAVSLADLAQTVTSGATPEAGNPRYYTADGGVPFAKIEDLTRAKGRYLELCNLRVTDVALRETAAKLYPLGTILLSMYGTIGLAKVCALPLAANQALCALVPPFRCDPGYLFHHLEHIRPLWSRFSGQTTQANISGGIVRAHRVPIPPEDDQVLIRTVLDILDTTIHQTETLIEKLKLVKHGLLHDLLNRGIDDNGELRPPLGEAPHLYKQSPLGWIPRDWACVSVRGAGTVQLGRQRSPQHERGRYLMPYLRVANVFDGLIDFSDVYEMNFNPTEQEVFSVLPGDIFLNEGQSLELVGRSALYDGPPNAYCYQNSLVRFRCGSGAIPEYLRAVFKRWLDIGKFMQVAKQTTSMAHLGADRFAEMSIALPSRREQELVVERARPIEVRLSTEEGVVRKLRLAKSGLMDDLLTGRVRVTPLLDAAAPA